MINAGKKVNLKRELQVLHSVQEEKIFVETREEKFIGIWRKSTLNGKTKKILLLVGHSSLLVFAWTRFLFVLKCVHTY